jgi:hypothetical protein
MQEGALAIPSTGWKRSSRCRAWMLLESAARHGQSRARIPTRLKGEGHPQLPPLLHGANPDIGKGRVEDVRPVTGAPHEASMQRTDPPRGASDVLTEAGPPRDPSRQHADRGVKNLSVAGHAVGVFSRDSGEVTIELDGRHSVTAPRLVHLSGHHSLGTAVMPAGARFGWGYEHA